MSDQFLIRPFQGKREYILFLNSDTFINCATFKYSNPDVPITFSKIERSLRLIRSEVFPRPPKTIQEVIAAFNMKTIMDSFGSSYYDKPTPFFKTAFHCEEFAYCIFSSDNIVNMIQRHIAPIRRHFLIDATFKVCPFGEFYQLLIIYVSYVDNVIVFTN